MPDEKPTQDDPRNKVISQLIDKLAAVYCCIVVLENGVSIEDHFDNPEAAKFVGDMASKALGIFVHELDLDEQIPIREQALYGGNEIAKQFRSGNGNIKFQKTELYMIIRTAMAKWAGKQVHGQ